MFITDRYDLLNAPFDCMMGTHLIRIGRIDLCGQWFDNVGDVEDDGQYECAFVTKESFGLFAMKLKSDLFDDIDDRLDYSKL